MNSTAMLAGRILLALIFIIAGYNKLVGFSGTVGYVGKLGFPMPEVMTVIAIAVELGAGVLLMLGWRARWMAWLLVIFVVIATFAAHRFWEVDASQYRNQLNHFLKNLALIGGLLYVTAFGAGRASIDKA